MQRRPRNPHPPDGPKAAIADPSLADLIHRARQLDALDRSLRDALPPALAGLCRLANAENERLVLLASSPAVAARLRLLQAELLDRAHRVSGARFVDFTVKVAPTPPVPRGTAPVQPLSPTAAAHLERSARLLADPELRDLFLRLASLAS